MIELTREDLDRVFAEFDRRVAFLERIGKTDVQRQDILQGVYGTLKAIANWETLQKWLPDYVAARLG